MSLAFFLKTICSFKHPQLFLFPGESSRNEAMLYHQKHMVMTLLASFLYSAHLPERLAPGRFDYIGKYGRTRVGGDCPLGWKHPDEVYMATWQGTWRGVTPEGVIRHRPWRVTYSDLPYTLIEATLCVATALQGTGRRGTGRCSNEQPSYWYLESDFLAQHGHGGQTQGGRRWVCR